MLILVIETNYDICNLYNIKIIPIISVCYKENDEDTFYIFLEEEGEEKK